MVGTEAGTEAGTEVGSEVVDRDCRVEEEGSRADKVVEGSMVGAVVNTVVYTVVEHMDSDSTGRTRHRDHSR